ncbi:MAG: hypothetical protein EOM21_17720 [Gammaproteobacteria bacterium]|nr:hypothetical protein [Gammaproteobacteria bacterium]
MKRLLGILFIVLLVVLLSSCEEDEVDTQKIVLEFSTFLKTQMVVESEDTEYQGTEGLYQYGSADFVFGEEDDGIYLMLFDGADTFTMQFALDEGKPFEIHVVWFDLMYANAEKEEYLYAEFYPDDTETAIIRKRFVTFLQELDALDAKDMRYLITEIGYNFFKDE